ncbi:MAG: cobalamin biosynthesis protein CbiX [Candidatus Thiodiazotropha sp.]
MTKATILLTDNGSSRPESTLNLRRLAERLGRESGMTIHPVSLQHADKTPPQALDGTPAQTFLPFMDRHLSRGERHYLVLPLFFGPSLALSSFLPQQAAKLAERHGAFELRQCPVLCPLPRGEPRLARILCDQLPSLDAKECRRVILVDHGSPTPQVAAVRNYLATEMGRILGPDRELREAVMERREGSDYDFSGASPCSSSLRDATRAPGETSKPYAGKCASATPTGRF